MGDRTGWKHPKRVMERLTHNLRSPRVFRHFGRKVLKTLLVLFVLIAQLGPYTYIASPASASSTVPKLLNYQARITNSSGVPVPDGNLNIWISVYDASSGGTCLYAMRGSCGTPSFKTVSVVNGVFSTLIGDTVGGDNAIHDTLFDASTLYLGITVASDTEMVPRKRLTTAPYAMNADRLDGLDVTSSGSTTPYIPSTTANGNLVITGDPQGTAVSSGALYVNPAGSTGGETLFGIADNGSARWMIDKEGDVTHVGSLLATAASSTSQFIFRGAASQVGNIFEVQDSSSNRVLAASATATTVTDLIVSGSCTGCGGSQTLQQAYNNATSTTELAISGGNALTLADTFNGVGNIFEIQNLTNPATGSYSQRYFTVSATNTTIGSASNTHSITPNARIAGNLTPTTDATFDLGDYNRRWRDLWLSGGSANIALDQSGTSVMRIGFAAGQSLRAIIQTPSEIPIHLRTGTTESV